MKRIIAILLLLALGWGAQAQFAGPDKTLVREDGNTQTTTIGTPGSADACYIWTGPHIDGNANQPVITVHPTAEAERYRVKRISENGVEEDEVWVFLEDTIEIRNVKPKYGCYSHGDALSTDQFEIETYPPGYEHLVTLSPTNAVRDAHGSVGSMRVTFSVTKSGHTSTASTWVKVINGELDATVGASMNILKLKETIENGKALKEKVDKFKNTVGKCHFLKKFVPCEPSWSVNVGGITANVRKKCCADHTPYNTLLVTFPSLSAGGGVSCRFPFYGIPHVATADVLLNLSFAITLGPAQGELSYNTQCCSFCIGGSLGATISGGVGVSLGGDLVQADLLLQGSGSVGCQWCPVGGGGPPCSFSGKVSIVGQLQLISILSYSIEFPLFTYSI